MFARLETEAELLSFETEWRALFQRVGKPLPFLDFDWMLMAWREVAARGGRPLLALVREKGQLVLALPLEARRFRGIFTRYCGLESRIPHAHEALMAPGDPTAWINALLRGLRRSPLDTLVSLKGLSEHSPFYIATRSLGTIKPYSDASVIDVPDGYAAFLKGFSGSERAKLRKAERVLSTIGPVALRWSTPDTFDKDLTWLLTTKRAWTPPGGKPLRGWLTDPESESNLRQLGRKWIATGQMRLVLLEAGGTPVAARILLPLGATVYFLVTTYDPAAAKGSPGRLLAFKLVEWGSVNGYRRSDMMGGNHDWKVRIRTGMYRQYRFKLPLRRRLF